MTDHARADRVVRHAFLAEQRAVGRDAMPAMMSPQMHCRDERRRRVVPQRREIDREAPARVDARPLVAQAQVAVGDVRDAAPAPADRPEDAPELLLRVAGCPRASRSAETCSRPRLRRRARARPAPTRPARMSSGSNPATTTGMRCRSTNALEDAPAGDRRRRGRPPGTPRRVSPASPRRSPSPAGCTCAPREPRSSAAARRRIDRRGRDRRRLEPRGEEHDLARAFVARELDRLRGL